MPSLASSSCWMYSPLALSDQATLGAFKKAARTASGVLRSGRGAPAGTAQAMYESARTTLVLPSAMPSAIS